ncbi:hypothetical protein A0O34_07095 [Chryseobacterium glaciei]|uniref:DUF2971 domain-containing protein n=1 Tax=Chryseobacterium glaciei TaxID=1685010 RepID=A0A172XTZ7_9FLAO|nr:hypothetical protein A0O34_07095 [Chryseobacterium glaciei]
MGSLASIKFSSAFNLNDPYELKFNLDIDPTDHGHREEYFKRHPSGTEKDFLSWQKHAITHDGYSWYAEQEIRNGIAQSITLCSFTQGNTNNLMWSHYTANHEGICIQYHAGLFEFFKKQEGFLRSGAVSYSDKPPTVKGLDKLNIMAEKIMFNKQSEWKYEKEHRVILRSTNNTDFLPIDRKYIKAIYIGSRAQSDIVNRILEVCRDTDIKVYYGITMGNTYEVSFREHKEGSGYMRAFWE